LESGPKFDRQGVCRLKDKQNKTVLLYKSVWDFKTSKEGRSFLAYNYEKIKGTLRNPDKVRVSKANPDSMLYYKKYTNIWLKPGIKVPFPSIYICVIVGNRENKKVIKTFYPTNRLKK